jgi:poly(ADP-ribose) glycohydrolase ARH3
MRLRDQGASFVGSLLGLALGDAFGAPIEGGPLGRALWSVIGTTADGRLRWTDDTQMSLDLAESLISCRSVDQDDIARRFAQGYRWSRGYGRSTARILKLVRDGVHWRAAHTRVFRNGSFGNGGAMRAPVIGLFCAHDMERVAAHARETAVITHAHPLGQEAAVLVALATALALDTHPPARKFSMYCSATLNSRLFANASTLPASGSPAVWPRPKMCAPGWATAASPLNPASRLCTSLSRSSIVHSWRC